MADDTTKWKQVKFETLAIGDEFECYGDAFINYDYPKVCKCIKINYWSAQEIGGVFFGVSPSDNVFVATKE